MSFSKTTIIEGVKVVESGTLTPKAIELTPGGSAGTTTTVVGSQTTDKTITLPDATDTLVGKSTTDVLINKTITAEDNLIQVDLAGVGVVELTGALDTIKADIADADSAIADHISDPTDAHDASAISNAPSGNLAATDVQGALNELQTDIDTRAPSATAVTLTGTQTLTNKTLTAPAITSPTGIVKGDVGLGSVDNTSDLAKPISTATQTALDLKQDTATAVTLTGTQTLTNKTLTAPVIDAISLTDQASTPATPSAGTHKAYVKTSTGKLTVLDSNGVEVTVGSGSGSKNYAPNDGSFEVGTTGYSLFNTTLTTLVPTGTITAGAASITTFNTTTTGKLGDSASLQIAASSAFAAGQGVITDAMSVDLQDRNGAVLAFSMKYSPTAGATNMNFSGTSANTFQPYVYDVTNSVWIQPVGVYSAITGSGVGTISGSFQTSATGTQYRLALICINASTGAATMLLDSYFIGPNPLAIPAGAIVTKVGMTTLLAVSANAVIKYDTIVNDSTGSYSTSTGLYTVSSAGSYRVSVVANLSASSSNIYVKVNGVVSGYLFTSSTSVLSGSTNLKLKAGDTVGIYSEAAVSFFGIATQGYTNSFAIEQIASAAGESSEGRDVSFSGYVTSNQAMTATVTNAIYTAVNDTMGAWTGSTYVVPVAGNYFGSLVQAATTGAAGLDFYINGVFHKIICRIDSTGWTSGSAMLPNLKAGDIISVRADSTVTLIGSTIGSFNLFRIPGNAANQGANPPSVSALYTGTPTGTLGNAFNLATIPNRVKDTHNAYVSGTYTVPVSGTYSISGQLHIIANATTGQRIVACIYIDGAQGYYTSIAAQAAANLTHMPAVNVQGIPLRAGQQVQLRSLSDASGLSYSSGGETAWFSISRTGNY